MLYEIFHYDFDFDRKSIYFKTNLENQIFEVTSVKIKIFAFSMIYFHSLSFIAFCSTANSTLADYTLVA